jgi:hypothetical protein
MAGGVPGRADDPQPEDLVAVGDRLQRLGRGDRRQVLPAGVERGVHQGRHVRDPAGMVVVLVGQDHVFDRVPSAAGRFQAGLDGAAGTRRAEVDDGRLTTSDQHIGGDEGEVDPLPPTGGRWCGGTGRCRRLR